MIIYVLPLRTWSRTQEFHAIRFARRFKPSLKYRDTYYRPNGLSQYKVPRYDGRQKRFDRAIIFQWRPAPTHSYGGL